MSLADYLAKHYLDEDSNLGKSKKNKNNKKKDKKKDNSTIRIVDEDENLNLSNKNENSSQSDSENENENENENIKKKKIEKKTWKPLGKIKIKSNKEIEIKKQKQKQKGGLKTAQEVENDINRKRKLEEKSIGNQEKNKQTVYRDATGRIIDLKKIKYEMERKKDEQERIKKLEIQSVKGDVQILQEKKEKKKLEMVRNAPLARYSDDVEINKQLKEKEIWEDPAASFLKKKKVEKKSETGLDLYKGNYNPNRFGIPPGHLWDGVDRSNGFEKRWIQRQNEILLSKRQDYGID